MMNKKEALEKYRRARERGEVDEDIIPLLEHLNSLSEYYTTSSCSGRIAVLEIPEIGDKIHAKFLGKWHHEVTLDDVMGAIQKYQRGYLFLLVQSSIIHVVARGMESACTLMRIALESGFKYTHIKNIRGDRVMIEILSTENLNIPLGKDGKLIPDAETLAFFTEVANTTLRRVKKKLQLFEENIRNLLLSSS